MSDASVPRCVIELDACGFADDFLRFTTQCPRCGAVSRHQIAKVGGSLTLRCAAQDCGSSFEVSLSEYQVRMMQRMKRLLDAV